MLPSLRKFNQSEVAKERQRIINYYDHYGGAATLDAFKVDRKLSMLFIYPRCPRINGCVERYNRTIQEEFIDQNLDSLLVDKIDFNHKLADYLIWYNSRRVHKSLNLKSPLQNLIERWSMSNKSVTYTSYRKL